MWILAGIWHLGVIPKIYHTNHEPNYDGLAVMLLGYLILSTAMVFLFEYVVKKQTLRNGFFLGVVNGFLLVFPHDIVLLGAHPDRSILKVVANGGWHLIEQDLGGVFIVAFLRLFPASKKSRKVGALILH